MSCTIYLSTVPSLSLASSSWISVTRTFGTTAPLLTQHFVVGVLHFAHYGRQLARQSLIHHCIQWVPLAGCVPSSQEHTERKLPPLSAKTHVAWPCRHPMTQLSLCKNRPVCLWCQSSRCAQRYLEVCISYDILCN